jgi:hypothetical protein
MVYKSGIGAPPRPAITTGVPPIYTFHYYIKFRQNKANIPAGRGPIFTAKPASVTNGARATNIKIGSV